MERARFPDLVPSLENLLKELARYDTARIDEDLFKEIYQIIVQKEDRHRVGEYYTPEWIAELTLLEALEAYELNKQSTSEIPSLLDPACGSGTFLTTAIAFFKQRLQETDPSDALQIILKKIEGADINPIAVYIARANYSARAYEITDCMHALKVHVLEKRTQKCFLQCSTQICIRTTHVGF